MTIEELLRTAQSLWESAERDESMRAALTQAVEEAQRLGCGVMVAKAPSFSAFASPHIPAGEAWVIDLSGWSEVAGLR